MKLHTLGLRMNKKSIFCLALSCCSMLGWSGLYGQHAFEAEIRGGIALFDLNPHPGDFLKGNQGWGSKADAVLWYSYNGADIARFSGHGRPRRFLCTGQIRHDDSYGLESSKGSKISVYI